EEVGAKRRHVPRTPAHQVLVREAARARDERDERSPQPRVELEQVADGVPHELPDADQPALRPLAAGRAVLAAEGRPAVEAGRNGYRDLIDGVRVVQDAPRRREAVREALEAVAAH